MTTPDEPGDRRPARVGRSELERAPGARYQPTGPTEALAARPFGQALGLGLLVAGILGGLFVVLGGVMSLSAGLLVLAGAIGWAVAQVMRPAASTAPDAGRRRRTATAISLVTVLLAQVGLWLFALAEGGNLPLLDYLAQARGILVPLEVLIAGLAAWWTAR